MHFVWIALALLLQCKAGVALSEPVPAAWPEQFAALLIQNRSGQLALNTLWYDWPNGRNLNLVWKQQSVEITDVEWNNGSSFIFEQGGSCRSLRMPVGILRPDWLRNATLAGTERIDGFECRRWEKADFITYWEGVATKHPVRWRFFDGAQFDVLNFVPNATLPDGEWQAPASCFTSQAWQDGNDPGGPARAHVPANTATRSLAALKA